MDRSRKGLAITRQRAIIFVAPEQQPSDTEIVGADDETNESATVVASEVADGLPSGFGEIYIKVGLAAIMLFIFWGGGYYLTSSPDANFDPESRSLLERIQTMDSYSTVDDIVALPQLSPAEQLVDRIFGPPGYKGNQ